MSKYTEVLTHLKENICKNCCTWDKSLRNCATCKVSVELESLEIADRLEQADAELHDTILYDLDRTVGIPNSGIFIQGYNQALADIRGDE